MVNRFISIFFWSFALLIGVVMMPLAVVVWALTAPWDTRRAVMHRFTCFWGSLYTWFNPLWSVRVEGRQNIQKGATYVMVANHASAADILVLYRLFRHFKWVSKIENFRVPIVGWNMRLNRYIPLRRGDKTSVLKMLDSCRRELATGSSVMMFPEGTRTRPGQPMSLQRGAANIAVRGARDITPVRIHCDPLMLPKGRPWWQVPPRRPHFTIRVEEDIAIAPFLAEGEEARSARELTRVLHEYFETS